MTKRKRRHYDANFKSGVALEAIKELKRSGPRKSESRLSEIPEVDYPTTGEKNEAKETKSFTGIQGKSSAGSHKRRFHVGSAFRAI